MVIPIIFMPKLLKIVSSGLYILTYFPEEHTWHTVNNKDMKCVYTFQVACN